jgi:hypothetical protein
VKLFNQLLQGISLLPQPSISMTSQVLGMMEDARVAPNQYTYTTLINIYANCTQQAVFPRGPSWLPPTNSPESREVGREALMKALSLYISMRLHRTRQQVSSPSSSGVPMATFNSLIKLVGTEDILDVTCHDIDRLHVQLAGDTVATQKEEQWTYLPLAKLQERYATRPLPLSAYLPVERTASEMTPLELLVWRDLAANDACPDRVTYNHLIFHLTAAGRLPHAEHYLRFVLSHSPLGSTSPPDSGAAQPDFLGRRHNPKYSSYLIKQRNDRRAQFAKLLAKTPPSALGIPDRPHHQPLQPTDTQSRRHVGAESREGSADNEGQLDAHGEAGSSNPLFLRTLWRVGEEYLRTHRFDDFVGCYHLAKQNYPVSATKCFGFLLRAWRTPGNPELVPDARAESALQHALRKHGMADPEAATSSPSPAQINALFQ